MKNLLHAIHAKIGHCLYRASVSLKEFGELKHIDTLISIGKASREFTMSFPIK
ncbi:hypothetical protein AGMMS50268_04060 [Spirochaetia bacterium]|nr:hypothetical protein AGMMS50268_04060 [Spirochaetia bacterium]